MTFGQYYPECGKGVCSYTNMFREVLLLLGLVDKPDYLRLISLPSRDICKQIKNYNRRQNET